MTAELEQNIGARRFRRGEATSRPFGGNVADEPFCHALYELAVFRGLETQRALAVALGKGKKGAATVSDWYRARNVPSPGEFGNILVVLDPTDPCRERLVSAYASLIAQGRGATYQYTPESRFERSQKYHKNNETDEVQRWIVAFCRQRRISLSGFFRGLGLFRYGNVFLGLPTLSTILEKVPTTFNLNQQETESLAEAVAKKIERDISEGHRFQDGMKGTKLLNLQKSLDCRTYNGAEAAEMLEVTREAVRKHRKDLRLPILMMADQVELLRNHIRTARKAE